MKYFIGILLTLLILGCGTLAILAIWDIYPVSFEIVWKTLLSIFGVSVIITVLIMMVTPFFKREKYEKKGNKAHLMNK